jgi:hypothetical protein
MRERGFSRRRNRSLTRGDGAFPLHNARNPVFNFELTIPTYTAGMWKAVRWWLLWNWREIAGVLVAAVFVACLLAAVFVPHRNANWGFEPEWTCSNYTPSYGAIVCFKQNPPAGKP